MFGYGGRVVGAEDDAAPKDLAEYLATGGVPDFHTSING
jgi:hypothetical protein